MKEKQHSRKRPELWTIEHKSVRHSPPPWTWKRNTQKKKSCETRRCMCANICSKLFWPNILSELLKHLSIQSSCLQEKFTLTVEGDDERGARETICHSWASQGCREHGLFITVWPGSTTHIPRRTETTQLRSLLLRYVHSHLEHSPNPNTSHRPHSLHPHSHITHIIDTITAPTKRLEMTCKTLIIGYLSTSQATILARHGSGHVTNNTT